MRSILIGAACVAFGIAIDALFLPHQSLWNDEATQLVGLTLNPVEVTRWLMDLVNYDFGVPDDRMPPLSYWIGWVWSQGTGLNETAMRWLGVVCVAIATAVLFATAERMWGWAAGAAAALLLATSPNVVTTSVEIRAYPMLILWSSGIFACLAGYVEGAPASRRRWMAGMVVCGLAAVYTHFFGLVALGGAFVAALVVALARGERPWLVLTAGGIVFVASLGLIPFILASAGLSKGGAHPTISEKLIGLVRLNYRLFSHPSMSLSPVAVAMAGLGLSIGVVCGVMPKSSRRGWVAIAMAIALISGLAVVSLAHLAQSAFKAASPSYNDWVFPPLSLLIAAGLAASSRAVRSTAVVAVVLLIAANLYADAQLAFRGDFFAHTPHRPIANLIRRLGPDQVAVIHHGTTEAAWHIYAPIHYDFQGRTLNYRFMPDASNTATDAVRVTEFPDETSALDPTSLPYPYLIVVRSVRSSAQDIACQIHTGLVPIGDGPVVRALLASGRWERIEEGSYLSYVGAHVDIFRKKRQR